MRTITKDYFKKVIKVKKRSDHFLNWNKILGEKVDSGNLTSKGIAFEDLIEVLIPLMFPKESWRRTQMSYDGKRDFVCPEDEFLPDRKWAECKNYNNNVSINVISPTLIMGAINGIEAIYFFSYSQLNDYAIDGLLQYSKSTNKEVRVFDGSVLDKLICKFYPSGKFTNFFPGISYLQDNTSNNANQLYVVRHLKDLSGSPLSKEHIFEKGEPFYIEYLVHNLSIGNVSYEILFSGPNDKVYIEFPKVYGNLQLGETKQHTFTCRAIISGNYSYTTSVFCRSEHGEKILAYISKGTLKISDNPYLFWSGKSALSVLRECKNHLVKYNYTPLIVKSKSGMGKSTLIDIITQDSHIIKNYTIVKLNLKLTRSYSTKNIFCQILGLQESDELPLDQIEDEQTMISLLINNYAESAATIAKSIIDLYNPCKPFLLVVDDVHAITRAYIDLINELDELSRTINKPIYFMFTLNEDIQSLDDFLRHISWNGNYLNKKCAVYSLSAYSSEDIIAFLAHKFGLTNIRRYFMGFDSSVSPLDMQRFSSIIKGEGVISCAPHSNNYHIVDDIKFSELVEKVLYAGSTIQTIFSSYDDDDVLKYVLKILYISGRISGEKRKKYKCQIEKLLDDGILKEVNGTAVFKHEKTQKYIGERLTFSEEDYTDIYFDKNTDNVSKAICALNNLSRINGAPEFLKKYFTAHILLRELNQLKEICWLVFAKIDTLADYGLLTEAIDFVNYNFKTLSMECNRTEHFKFLEHIVKVISETSKWDINSECDEQIAYFAKKYFDRALSTHNEKPCKDNYDKLVAIISGLKYLPEKRKTFWLCHYANRMAIVEDRHSVPLAEESTTAKSYYDLSESYFADTGPLDELNLQIIVDNFNRHYVYRHNLTEDIVSSCLSSLQKINADDINNQDILTYHISLLKFLSISFRKEHLKDKSFKLLSMLSDIKANRDILTSSFYRMKLYLIEVYVLIELKRFSEAGEIITRAYDFACKKGMHLYVHKLTYIKAMLKWSNFLSASESEINDDIFLAFEQLIDWYSNKPYDLIREVFVARQLISIIIKTSPKYLKNIISLKAELSPIIKDLCSLVSGKQVSNSELLRMRSFYIIDNIDYPTI